jgi:hypothetical protein
VSWLTPEQEAAHALESGIARSDLSEKAKLAYDWLVQHVDPKAQPAPAASTGDAPSQADSVTGSAASSPPAPAATTGDPQLAVEPLTEDSSPPGPAEDVDTNQLWDADSGQDVP